MDKAIDIANELLSLGHYTNSLKRIRKDQAYHNSAFPGERETSKSLKKAFNLVGVNCKQGKNKSKRACILLNKAIYKAPVGCDERFKGHNKEKDTICTNYYRALEKIK